MSVAKPDKGINAKASTVAMPWCFGLMRVDGRDTVFMMKQRYNLPTQQLYEIQSKKYKIQITVYIFRLWERIYIEIRMMKLVGIP